MINENYYEIIALITLITAVVIYLLIRKFKQDQIHIDYPHATKKSEAELAYEADLKKEEKKEKEEEKVTHKEETLEEVQPFTQEEPSSAAPTIAKLPRQKCEVPPHGKISKENFKDFKGVKLLVAEDNLINQKVINGLLSTSGIEVTMADDGKIALNILEKNSDFDMIIMDAHMPRIDGFEATRIIRANPKYEHIVVVALSGDTSTDDVRKMTEAGMEENLEKPLRMDAFYDVLYAYTQGDKPNEEQRVETITTTQVIMTNELKGDKGLAICGGDEEFYKAILSEFTQTYTNISYKLLVYLKEENTAQADALLLDFIGVTANIGADSVRVIALELKAAIKDLEESSYITILDEFDAHFEVLLEDIAEYN